MNQTVTGGDSGENERVVAGVPRRNLSVFDAACLIVGIIIGAGIYRTAPAVAQGAGGPIVLLVLWLAGGALSLCGAFGYAELATAWPQAGGDYVYLKRAYGRRAGFLFGWLQTVVVRPGDIAIMAFAFAAYARPVWVAANGAAPGERWLACGAVALLTGVNIAGVRESKWTQNVLTVVKVAGLLAIAAIALSVPSGAGVPASLGLDHGGLPLRVALILVLFTYGGWNEMAYVAAEVRNPRRNIARAMIAGTALVTGLYLLVNAGFLRALGFNGLAATDTPAADAVGALLPGGDRFVAALVCVSALGAVNGLIFAGARISYALGSDYAAFGALGRWDRVTGTPIIALLVQAGIAIGLIVVVGSFVDTILYTAAAVYGFYLATSIAVLVLRRREPQRERPFKVPGYPWPVLIFSATCLLLIHGAFAYKPWLSLAALVLILLGLPVERFTRGHKTTGS